MPPVPAASADTAATPPVTACCARAMEALMAPEFRIIGRNRIARKTVRPLNFPFRIMAMNRLKKIIRGTSISMFPMELTRIWLYSAS